MWGPKNGRNGYITPAFSGVPTQRDKIKRGYFTLAFSGANMWAEWLHSPNLLGVPNTGTTMVRVGPVENCPQGLSLKKKIWFLKDTPPLGFQGPTELVE